MNLFAQQALDACLELTILGGIYERVDAAVCEHEHHAEVREDGRTIDRVTEHCDKIVDLKRCPAYDVAAANHQ